MTYLKQKGWTLLELMMVTVVVGIVGLGAVEMLRLGAQVQISSQKNQALLWDGELAMTRITEDLHMIQSPSSISAATVASLTFKNMNGTTITYSLSGHQLMRNSYALANNVTSFSLSYLDQDGNVTTTLADIRYIGVNLTLSDGLSFDFTTGVFIWSAY